MIKKSLLAFCAFSFALSWSQPVRACMCSISSAESMFATADVVFIGKVIKNRSAKESRPVMVMKESDTLELVKDPKWEQSFDKVQRVTLEVTEAFKGVTGNTVELVTNVYNGGGSCGVHFKVGESYLVYAHRRQPLLLVYRAIGERSSGAFERRKFSEVASASYFC